MSTQRLIVCILVMALVTYIPRVLPVTVFRKQIKSRFIRSFLDYTPYAVLGALTFPDVLYATGSYISAAAGMIVAMILGIFQAKPGGGGCCSHWRCISGGNTIQ